ncbi:MFS general substrate transporter [Cantharellus anzutake]|uniref:MFS general substrate transporter n=1 Tax=Cantharellus anzutake TaxID=1750568 RepID=UPI0019050070|nr:MFS general substrate transporter [Cantharellus anzutake]KAF8329110.1 MFS general substrate transporter [Cantharellus anzutake]
MAGGAPIVGVSGSELGRRQWAIAFSLVSTLFFTWGFAYGLLDVLNKHFQVIFGITKTQSTLLQLAYFGAYLVFSPFAGLFMRRYGYKKGIHLGLSLYTIGAAFYWPCAKYEVYGGFVACTFVIGCGLSALEVAANSYITVLGSPKYAAARLNFSQGWQGVASFSGPLIASRWFFTGKNATSLDTVQYVYLAVACLGITLNVLFYFTYLPEITEEKLAEEMRGVGIMSDAEPFHKQYRTIFGFIAQFCYVGAQVAVASFVVNYLTEGEFGLNKTDSQASNMFSYCQITFTVGRFVGVVLLNFIDPAALLTFYAICCTVFCIGTATATGVAGIACLYCLFFFESICYPVIFTLGTKNLGVHTKKGSALIVMGVAGGAWYPSAQGALADRTSTHHSYLVPMTGFIVMLVYAAGIVITQGNRDGFRISNVDEIQKKRASIVSAGSGKGDLPGANLPSAVETAERTSKEKDSANLPIAEQLDSRNSSTSLG